MPAVRGGEQPDGGGDVRSGGIAVGEHFDTFRHIFVCDIYYYIGLSGLIKFVGGAFYRRPCGKKQQQSESRSGKNDYLFFHDVLIRF